MNLPKSVDDTSLLNHEPLRTHIAVFECAEGRRSAAKDSLSEFVKAMQQDSQAAAAAKRWACLVFSDPLSGECSLELTDGGEALYKVFFKYQHLLYRSPSDARSYEAHVHRSGISFISATKLNDNGANTQRAGRGRGRGIRSRGQDSHRFSLLCSAKSARSNLSSMGDTTTTSILDPEAQVTKGSVGMPQELPFDSHPATGARLTTLSDAGKSRRHPASKKEKKRKASSQKPPVITPSDASEEDKEPSETRAIAATDSISCRSKRIASIPSRKPDDVFGVKHRMNKTNSAYRTKTIKQRSEGSTNFSKPQSSLADSPLDVFASRPRVKCRRGATFSPISHKHYKKRLLNVSTRPTRANFDSRRLQKKKLVRDPQPRATKRMRRASMSAAACEPEGESESAHDLGAKFLKEFTIQQPLVNGPPFSREDFRVESKTRKKRTRLEFEAPSVASDGNTWANSHEPLGPDIRLLRPLPRKIRDMRSVLVVREAPASLEHADQLLRDIAGNAMAMIREGIGPDIPDWTQDKEHDAECEDLDGGEQDGANVQVITTASSPPKPPVPAPALIWAQSRQEVCESVEYFRCYHSGVYSKDDIVKGYLLGAYAASRDIFHHGGKLIISHGGGKSESILDVRGGPRRYQTDQDQEASDKSVRALLKTCKDRRPIVLLADDKYALFPYDLTSINYTYVVLGLYWISHAWAECQPARDGSGRIVRWKFTFQWCEGQGDPWWLPRKTDTASELSKIIPDLRMCPTNSTKSSSNLANKGGDPSIQCEHCQEHSPFVYKQGWMCLNPGCELFWSIDGKDPTQLDYREEFLTLLPQRFERLPNITPTKVVETPGGVTTTYAFSKGWHCTKCGRLSCRFKWEYWECSNCGFKHVVNGRIRSPKEFWHQRPSKGFLHSQIGKDSGILGCHLEPINLGAHKGFTNRLTFILPQRRGKIHLILGTPLSNGDADDIFQLYQQQAATGELKLRRYPLRNHRARGSLLTNYFSQNSGEPYQYVGGSGQTVPFCDAPDCVRRALALIKERSGLALRADIPFNEILSAAYMERQKMSFHSDSERGLGPTVASLSLGSAALMHFRPHVNMGDPKPKSAHALTLVLRHGDVLIMDGDGVQKYYEHTVVPMNFRIAATARCIGIP